jgi:hypothetical protein
VITVNGNAVLGMRLTMPVVGNWVAAVEADVAEDDDVGITGTLTIQQDGIVLRGTVIRSGVIAGVCRFEAVGGTGGLRGDVVARSFQGVTARAILADTLAACGEVQSAASTRATLSTALPYWTRAAGRASTAVSVLADALGAHWRVTQAGQVWVGTESWPAMAADFDAVEIDSDPGAGLVVLAPENIALKPGVLYGGRRVGRVEHTVGRDSALRTTFWEEA